MRSDKKKDVVQQQAKAAWKKGGEWGLLGMATGTGKSKIAIDIHTELNTELFGRARVLLVVPTEKLRDDNWREEYDNWGAGDLYKNLQRSCYASILKLDMQTLDLVIFDEGHNLTPANSVFFERNIIKRVLILTATPPDPKGNQTDKDKIVLFKQFRLKTDFYYPLEKAVADGLVAPYEMFIVETSLDDTSKYITAGTKDKPFMQTEADRYKWLSKIIQKMMISKNPAIKFQTINRMRIVYNSIAKTDVAKKIIAKYAQGNRTLVFCGSIDQAENLCPGSTYHSKTTKDALQKFMDLETELLGVVQAANEGLNIPQLDIGIIVQLNSNARDLVQRVGRLIRKRPGHKAVIFIIIAKDTVDKKWFESAIDEFDKSVIRYVDARNI